MLTVPLIIVFGAADVLGLAWIIASASTDN